MNRLIKSMVETPHRTDIEYQHVPPEWDEWTHRQRDAYLADVAVDHQNNVAPCSAIVVDVDDEEWRRIIADGRMID